MSRRRHVPPPPITDRFVPGQPCWYVMSPLRGSLRMNRYLRVDVVHVTDKRVVVRPVSGGNVRSVQPWSLTHQDPPEGAVIV